MNDKEYEAAHDAIAKFYREQHKILDAIYADIAASGKATFKDCDDHDRLRRETEERCNRELEQLQDIYERLCEVRKQN